jgi:uncharacterized protein
MIFLLDVNLLIALLDANHVHNESAHRWVANHGKSLRWASCPITENAFLRITGSPSYPNSPGSTAVALRSLKQNCTETNHSFWPDDLSVREETLWTSDQLLHSSHITDCYLLALAVKNGGKLASFDRKIPAHLVRGGTNALHLVPG